MKRWLLLLVLPIVAVLVCRCTPGKENGQADSHSFTVESSTPAELPAKDARISLEVKGDVFFTGLLARGEGDRYTGVKSLSGNGNKSFVLDIPDNTASSAVSYRISLSTTENVAVPSYQFDYTQAAGGSGQIPDPGTDPDPDTEQREVNVVVTEETCYVSKYSSVLDGSYLGFDIAPRETGFEWGISSSGLDNVLQSEDIAYEGDGTFSALLEGLSDGTTYYYRAYVVVWTGGRGVYYYGDILSFTTEKDSDTPEPPSGESNQPGWYELPVMNISASGNYKIDALNSDLYYAWHMCSGGEKGPGGKTARNYTVCFSAGKHCPVWVAAPRHSMYNGSANRSNAYRQDAKIPTDLQYKSKETGGGCNKGHMLGSAERTSSSATNRDVFFYTNIAPQLSAGFNTGGGGWNTLEDWVDAQVCSDTLYVIIGCYFDTFTDGYGYTVSPMTISFGGRNDVGFPTMFYYILMRTKNGSSGKALKDCITSEIKCAAFVRSHTNSLKGQKVSSREMMSVSDLEKITGFTYFPNVPNAPKDNFKASDWGL